MCLLSTYPIGPAAFTFAMQYDATLKHLVEKHPLDWVRLLHIEPVGNVTVIESDVSTVTAAADKVIRVDEEEPWLLQIEFQSSYDPSLPERMHFYSTLLSRRHGLAVRSVAVLLRRDADGRGMSGTWSRAHLRTGRYIEFWYDVLRVWEVPAETFLGGGPGVLPLSVVTEDAVTERLPSIMSGSRQAALALGGPDSAREVLAAEYVLLGLRFPREFVKTLFREVREMKESTTYQAILEEGEEQGVRRSILIVGEKQFGRPAEASVRQALESIHDLDRLTALLDRVLTASDWSDLLNGSSTP